MSSSSPPAPQVIDIGAAGWCWSQLRLEGEGVLSYEARRGRVSLAVPYAVADRQISVALAWSSGTGWRAVGAESRLEVTGLTPDGQRWVVRATGLAEPRDLHGAAGLARSRRMHPANGADDGSAAGTEVLVLRKPRVRGFYETLVPL